MDAKDVILAVLIALTVGVQLGTWLAKRATSKVLDETIDVLGAVKEKLLTPGTVAWGVVEIMGHRRFVGRLSTTYVLNEPALTVEQWDLALLDKLPMGPSECASRTDLIMEGREDDCPF